MKSRGKLLGQRWWSLGLPSVFLLCLFFFLVGLFGSTLISQQDVQLGSLRSRSRVLESVEQLDTLPNGETGEHSLTSIPFQVLSWFPRALYFPNFATEEQCQGIIKMAKAELKPSALALRKGETAENTKGIRTSSGMFISSSEDKTGILDLIEEKIARATMIPRTHGEAFNVLRYEIGQSYHSHYDAFDPSQYGPQKSQRVASFLLYLSDVEEGGETMFPFENAQNMDANYDFRKCIGLKVKPRRGDGLLFYSLFPNDISSRELSSNQRRKMGCYKVDQGSGT
ncbi:putative prolyl 4-hydroxylase 9 isoform X1 [Nicotiana tabacum]|uniref:Probable prolyl 4-hydroxylase 9 isoform X2 n=2 Tax=Nicotiana TaxID=4085 RepID=A0A1S4D5L8_TOBAC|nr:PREDICTED: probable prolyl 4-hydroxylase 9 isoform X2 [Nicotiana sylvestris]XP_016508633.1 PREDICTED: probable prolyl 4-hydroxylase 9 isoform X2 [Nicotiana tabacum]